MKQTRRAGLGALAVKVRPSDRPRNPWRARSKLAARRLLFPKLPSESLKNTLGNMTHCPLLSPPSCLVSVIFFSQELIQITFSQKPSFTREGTEQAEDADRQCRRGPGRGGQGWAT